MSEQKNWAEDWQQNNLNSVFIPGYAQRGKVSVLLVDVKKNTNAWITHGSVTRIDHGTMEKY